MIDEIRRGENGWPGTEQLVCYFVGLICTCTGCFNASDDCQGKNWFTMGFALSIISLWCCPCVTSSFCKYSIAGDARSAGICGFDGRMEWMSIVMKLIVVFWKDIKQLMLSTLIDTAYNSTHVNCCSFRTIFRLWRKKSHQPIPTWQALLPKPKSTRAATLFSSKFRLHHFPGHVFSRPDPPACMPKPHKNS